MVCFVGADVFPRMQITNARGSTTEAATYMAQVMGLMPAFVAKRASGKFAPMAHPVMINKISELFWNFHIAIDAQATLPGSLKTLVASASRHVSDRARITPRSKTAFAKSARVEETKAVLGARQGSVSFSPTPSLPLPRTSALGVSHDGVRPGP